MNQSEQQCYWCGKQAISREHVPPRCLFPADKDVKKIFNQSFRSELITVPSCDEHNSLKSGEDEYLMACLTARVGNNIIAYAHTNTKLRRSLKYNKNLLQVQKNFNLKMKEQEFPVSLVNIEVPRLSYSFEAIARALYYHEYRVQHIGECLVLSNMFLSQNKESLESNQFIQNAIIMIENEQKHWKTQIKGRNPLIFQYQFSPVDGFGAQTLALNFYEQTKVYVCLSQMSKLKPHKNSLETLGKLYGLFK
ncbi:hypothetical protein [Paenibacillus pabuli]|uniref:hypothetical protein n=1 Tax=Paenibacillus pabuli TaxID=1472 RepID=UPI003CF5312E